MGDFKKRLKHYQRKRIEIYFELCYHSMVISSSTQCYILLNSFCDSRSAHLFSYHYTYSEINSRCLIRDLFLIMQRLFLSSVTKRYRFTDEIRYIALYSANPCLLGQQIDAVLIHGDALSPGAVGQIII